MKQRITSVHGSIMNLIDVFNFDIFSHQFDKHQRYQIFSTQYADILIIRLENLTTAIKKLFMNFSE